MDRIQQKITVDLTNGSNEVVYCNQYDDNSREIVISLENNGNIRKNSKKAAKGPNQRLRQRTAVLIILILVKQATFL